MKFLSATCLLFTAAAGQVAAQSECPGRYPVPQTSLSCTCSPDAQAGSVWGSGPYTGDSDICTAAVHAGAIGAAGGGPVTALLAPGADAYSGSAANGVTTRDWGSYGDSYVFEIADPIPAGLEMCGAYPTSQAEYSCGCPAGSGTGSVWGSGPYTGDSNICAAAVHAGVIPAAGGPVTAMAFPGLTSYLSSSRNGVETMDWGSYALSYVFDANREY
ncbi:LCCL domain-containing protein [Roseisalinus antarcticus]|uniref:LCCL domain protein n=1 Tax=Roseisalinus antarcticus TaxID=254357 RepID=A0A1Y5TYP9_9RHOB|nr:LCCL domain-containing protein [Roseisalinus antarcticus]SLN71798.1 LCCL domain protein [Roseisalinus antarcticus]